MLTPEKAYDKALKEGPSDDTRKAVLSNSRCAYYYARDIDKVIFGDNYNIHYFIDLHNIGMRYIRKEKFDTGIMALNILYLDVL